ncbi:Histone-lysine N-methyltransferase [Melia azedarach]|uniref:Histone-lysine N-methyltransferase n=1 Tax=Melia azedarach TaxID=155640 RepID=A0ACC1YC20_MELAZ|nr:Histone-lysine N-methyltransferase [Melia azedarach]
MTLSNATTNQRNCRQNTTEEERKQNLFLHCAHLVLPWLTPAELANASLTCKTLLQISKSITLSRSLDASRSFENLAIPFHNTADNIPYAYFIYTPSQIIASSCSQSLQRQFWGSSDAAESNSMRLLGLELVSRMDDTVESVSGCECENCLEVGHGNELFGCPCFSGLEDVGIVSECGPSCACGPECENRLTQRGISVRLKIVRDVQTGWGLYADQLIQQGQFICEYAGELLTTKEARGRQQIYDELASRRCISSALLVVREHLPSGKACLRMNIDATRVGNVARFINHACDGGNLSTVVVRSVGSMLPRLCFFASKDIKEGEELTFSYGEIRVRSKGLQCFCGSSSCFGILPAEHT